MSAWDVGLENFKIGQSIVHCTRCGAYAIEYGRQAELVHADGCQADGRITTGSLSRVTAVDHEAGTVTISGDDGPPNKR